MSAYPATPHAPVLAQSHLPGNRDATVLLGADDRHLRFRSCVGVRIIDRTQVEVMFGTQVACRKLFGRFYLRTIDAAHRRYIAPTTLRTALQAVLVQERDAYPAQLHLA